MYNNLLAVSRPIPRSGYLCIVTRWGCAGKHIRQFVQRQTVIIPYKLPFVILKGVLLHVY